MVPVLPDKMWTKAQVQMRQDVYSEVIGTENTVALFLQHHKIMTVTVAKVCLQLNMQQTTAVNTAV